MIILVSILLLIAMFFIMPFLAFGGGWLLGQLIKITIGGFIVQGFELVGLHIPLESLPLFFAVLNVVAMFFHSVPSNTFNNKKD